VVVARKIRAGLAPCSLGAWPTPLENAPALAAAAGLDTLWIKREDKAGGSKVRGLEFLLEDAPGMVYVTIGGTGSSHCLATATQAARVGGRAVLAQFPQPTSDGALAIATACAARATIVNARSMLTLPFAVWSAWRRAAALGPRRWIPGGGAHPRAVIGHFLAGLELAQQLANEPDAVVLPLGSTGTAGGLMLAMEALGWRTRVVGVRVAPAIVANGRRARRLAQGARRILGTVGVDVPRPRTPIVLNGAGRGYGYPSAAGEQARRLAAPHGLVLDSTYSAKAFAALPDVGRLGFRRVVFWHTFAHP